MTGTEQKNHFKSNGIPLKILVDIPLLNLLCRNQGKTGKLSRVQALRDLLERQDISLLKNDDEYLKGNIQEFSNQWGWDRDTVARFLNELEEVGTILSDNTGVRRRFKLNYLTEKEINFLAHAKLAEPIKESLATH